MNIYISQTYFLALLCCGCKKPKVQKFINTLIKKSFQFMCMYETPCREVYVWLLTECVNMCMSRWVGGDMWKPIEVVPKENKQTEKW